MAPSPESEQPSSNTNDKSNINQNNIEDTLKDADLDEIAKHFFDDDPEMQIEPNMRPNDVLPDDQNHTTNPDASKNTSAPPKQTSVEKNATSDDHLSTTDKNQDENEKEKDISDKTTDKATGNANEDTDEIMSDPKTTQLPSNENNEQQRNSTTPNNDSTSKPQKSQPTPPASEPPQRRKRQTKQQTPSHPAPESHLFQKVLNDPASGPSLMASCLEDVVHNGPGMLSVTLSLITSAGRPVAYAKERDLVTPNMILSNDPKAAVDKIDEIVRNDEGGRIALVARDTIAKRVRRSFEDMWKKAITNANAEVLRTTDFYETVCTWLESMVLSRSRAIRIAACLAAFRLTDGLLESRMRVRKELASVQRQLQTEKRKCAKSNVSKRSRSRVDNSQLSPKGQELTKKVTELTEESEMLYELAEELFSTIFIIKYRDVSPEIRATAISALGGWIIYNPEHFLDEIHSKYIGWLLSDRESVVRKAAIHAIARALKEEQLHEHLGTFLDRFSDRIVEMSRDKDDHVAVAAIDVLTSIIPYDILTNEASEKICEMAVNERHRDIRRAAGRFLARLSKTQGSEALPSSSTARGPQKRARGKTTKATENENGSCDLSPEQALADLRVFITSISGKSDDISDCRRVVNAVWESFPALRCWDSIIDLLLDKDSQRQKTQSRSGRRVSSRRSTDSSSRSENQNPLNADEKTLLCGVLLSSIQELQADELSATAKTAKKKDAETFRSMRTVMTRRLLNRLPEVFRRFQFDSLSLEALVQIPAYFDLEGLDGEETESHFNLMLNRLLDVMNRNTASQTIAEDCARTFKVLLSDKNPMKQQAVSSLQIAFGTISKELSLYVSSDLSNAEPHSLASNVFRTRLLTEMIEPNNSIQSCIKSLLEYQLKNESPDEHEEEITKNALRTACAILVWSLSKISSSFKEINDTDAAIDGILETDEAKERLALMTEMQLLLRQTCEKEELSLSVRITSLQMLLTALTLSRGIEKFAISQAMKTKENDDAQEKSVPNITLLMDDTERERTTKAVVSCVHTLLRDGIDSENAAGSDQNEENAKLSNQMLTACFASLVQASFQSSISSQIAHLPLLGLLLKPGETEDNDNMSSYSVTALCREYAMKRRLGFATMTKTEIAAFQEVIFIADSTKQRRNLLRKLAEILFSFGGKPDIAKRARSSITKLCEHALNSRSEKKALEDSLEVLCTSSYVYLPHLGHEDFTVISKQLQVIWNAGRQQSIITEESSESSFFDNFHDCVTELARDENAEASKVVKMFDGTKSKTVVSVPRRKRLQADPAFHLSSSSPGSGEIRRSKRARTVIDYASIEESDSGEDPNEQREGAEDADEEVNEDSSMPDVDQELDNDTELQTPEEMAREMVQFRNSPGPDRARRNSRSREVIRPPVRSSPRKSRPSSSASTPKAVSGKKPPKAPSKSPRTPRATGTKTRRSAQNPSNESCVEKPPAVLPAASEERTPEEEHPSQANGHEENDQSTATDSPASRLRSRRSTRSRPDTNSSSRISSEGPNNKTANKNTGSKETSGDAPSTEAARPVIRRKRRRW